MRIFIILPFTVLLTVIRIYDEEIKKIEDGSSRDVTYEEAISYIHSAVSSLEFVKKSWEDSVARMAQSVRRIKHGFRLYDTNY